MNKNVQVSIDWCTFTVKAWNPVQVVTEILAMDYGLFQSCPHGYLRYRNAVEFHNIRVCWNDVLPGPDDPFGDLGVMVSMSGEGCKAFIEMSKYDDFPTFFFWITQNVEEYNFTRIDVACDDKTGLLNMETICQKVNDGEINSRSSKRSVIVSHENQDICGRTAYIGAPSSDFRIRFYDKAAEQGVDGSWVRCELVFRGNHANNLVLSLLAETSLGFLTSQILNDKFSFIVRDNNNITRCSKVDWWLQFVDELSSIHLVSSERMTHPLLSIAEWFTKSLGPTLSLLANTFGPNVLLSIASDSYRRMDSHKRALLADYQNTRIDKFYEYDLEAFE